MLLAIVINGVITAVLLFLISWLLSFINIPFLSMSFGGNWVALAIAALILGVVNALLVPLVMQLFKKARGLTLFAITVVVDTIALLLIAHFISALSFGNWWTAVVVALILAAVGFGAVGATGQNK
ncbi:MAG: phage holin family protein [Defluviitaleaceae bacterium]|nr:phage holin family protein [Defluviitaleaceae bacterium]